MNDAPADLSLSPATEAVWLRTLERLLHGLTHALSNRVGAVAAVAEVLEPGDDELLEQLRLERRRMGALVAQQRLLVRERGEAASALPLGVVLGEAHALARLDFASRDTLGPLADLDAAPPVRVRRVRFIHGLVVLLVHAADGGAPAALDASWTEDEITIDVGGGALPPDVLEGAAALLSADGALVRARDGGGATVALPTLARLRRG